MDISVLSNPDVFFYYGQNDLQLECESDLLSLAIQENRSLYYNRQEAGGVSDKEGNPEGFMMQIMTRFALAQAVSYRNSQVTNGSDNTKDRRIAISQNSIGLTKNKSGKVDVEALYFLYSNYTKPKTLNISI